jgi:hypothetical protein
LIQPVTPKVRESGQTNCRLGKNEATAKQSESNQGLRCISDNFTP